MKKKKETFPYIVTRGYTYRLKYFRGNFKSLNKMFETKSKKSLKKVVLEVVKYFSSQH